MAVVIVRDRLSGVDMRVLAGRRMYLATEDGTITLSVTVAPNEIEYGGFIQQWTQTDRSGNTPLLLRKGKELETLKFSTLLVEPLDQFHVITGEILAVKALAETRQRVLVSYSRLEAGLWRVTEASVSSERRHPDAENNEPIRAIASITLTRASDPAVAIGPVTGGTQPAPGSVAPSPPRTYTVVKGDSLWAIAQRYYGKGTLWPRIFDANRGQIKDSHWIYPGQKFVIP